MAKTTQGKGRKETVLKGLPTQGPLIHLYTDGSCYLSNPSTDGGWACLFLAANKMRCVAGHINGHVTNNVAETTALLMALDSLLKDCRVILFTDSEYVMKGIMKIRRRNKTLDTNKELWEQVKPLVKRFILAVNHVKAHNGNKYNEFCDEQAKAAANLLGESRITYDGIIDTITQTTKRRKKASKRTEAGPTS